MCTKNVHTSRWRPSNQFVRPRVIQIGRFNRSQGHASLCSDLPRIIQISAVGPVANEVHHFWALPFGLNTAPLIFMRIVESIASHIRQSHCLNSRACVSLRLAVQTPRSRNPSRIGARDIWVPPISGMGGQFREVISDPKSEFRVSRPLL